MQHLQRLLLAIADQSFDLLLPADTLLPRYQHFFLAKNNIAKCVLSLAECAILLTTRISNLARNIKGIIARDIS